MFTRWRANICSRRYSGRWSAILLVTTYARSPGPANPFSIGCWGFAARSIWAWPSHFWQCPELQCGQAYLWRMCSRTTKLDERCSNCSFFS